MAGQTQAEQEIPPILVEWWRAGLDVTRRRHPELDDVRARTVTERWMVAEFHRVVAAVKAHQSYVPTLEGLLAGLDATYRAEAAQ